MFAPPDKVSIIIINFLERIDAKAAGQKLSGKMKWLDSEVVLIFRRKIRKL